MGRRARPGKPDWGWSRLCIILGLLLILASAGLSAANQLEDRRAQAQAQQLLQAVEARIPAVKAPFSPGRPPQAAEPTQASEPVPPPVQASEAPQADLDNLDAIGILSIEAIGLRLPVLAEESDALLKLSVCRLDGGHDPWPDRLIIAGHNYRSHFGRLKELAVGARVCFQGMSGAQYVYEVSAIEEIGGNDVDALYAGAWDITLFTCNFDGSKRLTLRCSQV